jgi:hypothetical protein
MVAPTGERILREVPLVHIICGPCFETARCADTVELAGSAEEIAREVRSAHPNLRRSRN